MHGRILMTWFADQGELSGDPVFNRGTSRGWAGPYAAERKPQSQISNLKSQISNPDPLIADSAVPSEPQQRPPRHNIANPGSGTAANAVWP